MDMDSWIPDHILEDMARIEKEFKELMSKREYEQYRRSIKMIKKPYIPGKEELEFRQALREQRGRYRFQGES